MPPGEDSSQQTACHLAEALRVSQSTVAEHLRPIGIFLSCGSVYSPSDGDADPPPSRSKHFAATAYICRDPAQTHCHPGSKLDSVLQYFVQTVVVPSR